MPAIFQGNHANPHSRTERGRCRLYELLHGERLESKAFSSAPIKSQFALPHGERLLLWCHTSLSTKFQFALPYGERPPSACKGFLMFSFNSRSRMESDSDRYAARHPGCSFNSRSRMESDRPHRHRQRPPDSFNSRSRMESDGCSAPPSPSLCRFNSRSRMESDRHHAMAGTACIESALFASQAGKVQWCKTQFVCHVFKSISIQHAISAANTPAFR